MRSWLLKAAVARRDREQALTAEDIQDADDARMEWLNQAANRRCSVCKITQLTETNVTGVCTRSKECKTEYRRLMTAHRRTRLRVVG